MKTRSIRWRDVGQAMWILGLAGMLATGGDATADEFRVNTSTESHQLVKEVVVDGQSGTFLVVWSSLSSLGDDDWDYSIQGQRFGANGERLDGQVQINTWTTGRQVQPSAAVSPVDGNIMVAWDHEQPVGTGPVDVRARVFQADGTPLDDDFRVNSYPGTAGYGSAATAVGGLSTGDFVVVWQGVESATADLGLQARMFQGDGTPQGEQFTLPTETGAVSLEPRVAAHDDNGEFLVVWWRLDPQSGSSIIGHRFTSNGTTLGDAFEISSATAASRRNTDVAFEPGSQTYVVVWEQKDLPATAQENIFMRRVTSDGTLQGPELMVNTWTLDDQDHPRVAADPAGGDFEVVWGSSTTPNVPGSQRGVRARRFGSDGIPLADDRQVNVSGVPDALLGLAVALSPTDGVASEGEPFVVWTDFAACGDADLTSVGAFFEPVVDPCAIHSDGFELGDFSGWSTVLGTVGSEAASRR